MMATVPHVTSGLGLRKFQSDGFLSDGVYHMEILLGDFNAKVGRKNVFQLTIGNESLHQDGKDMMLE
jgi:hypothetical protein